MSKTSKVRRDTKRKQNKVKGQTKLEAMKSKFKKDTGKRANYRNVTSEVASGKIKRNAEVVTEVTMDFVNNKTGVVRPLTFPVDSVENAELIDGATNLTAKVILDHHTNISNSEEEAVIYGSEIGIQDFIEEDAWRLIVGIDLAFETIDDEVKLVANASRILDGLAGEELNRRFADTELQAVIESIELTNFTFEHGTVERPIKMKTLKDYVSEELEDWQINPFTDLFNLPTAEGTAVITTPGKAEKNGFVPGRLYYPADTIVYEGVVHMALVRTQRDIPDGDEWQPFDYMPWAKLRKARVEAIHADKGDDAESAPVLEKIIPA